MQHKSFLTCSVFLSLCFISALTPAQTPKRSVTNAAELPRFVYDVPEKLTDLLNDDATYKTFTAKVRADLESVLRDYEIKDEVTLKQLYKTLAHLDLQDGNLDSVLKQISLIRELESKPEVKILPPILYETEAIAKAQKQSGVSSGVNYEQAFRQVLTEMFNRLPATFYFYEQVKGFRDAPDFLNDKFAEIVIETELAPEAKKNGNKLNSRAAYRMIETQTLGRFFVPLAHEMRKSAEAYLATHNAPANRNIWTSRAMTLTHEQKLAPVVIAVWDTGVDPTVFPHQMFVNRKEKPNGKDNDGNGLISDVYGIGFDEKGKYTPAPLFIPKDTDFKQYSEWVKQKRVYDEYNAGVDSEETRAFRRNLQTETAAQAIEKERLNNVYTTYNHGTSVAGVAVAGNPAARILIARWTWRDHTGQPNSVKVDEGWARGLAANIKAFVDYFKKHNVRVVNMSWHLTPADFEETLEKHERSMSSEARKRTANKNYLIVRNALSKALSSAPEILFVAAAGNSNNDAGFTEAIPASFELQNLITVGAVDESGAAANFTSFGKTVGLYAWGVNVEAPVAGGTKLKFGGTSAAAPQTANLAAKLFALNPKLTVSQVIQLIRDGADVSSSDKRLRLINPKRSVELLTASQRR